jgi:hypothetical protein
MGKRLRVVRLKKDARHVRTRTWGIHTLSIHSHLQPAG